MTSSTCSSASNLPVGTTGTGLDRIPDIIRCDSGLANNVSAEEIATAVRAADAMNGLIAKAIAAGGLTNDHWFDAADARAVNAFLRAGSVEAWTGLHGDDEGGAETGFHLVQNDGASTRMFKENAVDTVFDGIFHIGLEIRDDRFLNEDGDPNATVQHVADWINYFYTDQSTTGTGLDAIVDLIKLDRGLACNTTAADINDGAAAANAINGIIAKAITKTGAADDNWFDATDVEALNGYIRDHHRATWTELHGDDEGKSETGFHKVQNDGASTKYFGQNLVNTVADGIYHLGFEICGDRLLNEDGDPNATLEDVAAWLTWFYTDPSTTGSGLDAIVDGIKTDPGLVRTLCAWDINTAAVAADGMNHIIDAGLIEAGAVSDGWITVKDVRAVNAFIRGDAELHQRWVELHGDDEGCEETGFHLVQNDGATSTLFGKNFVNTIADGIFHLGFAIECERLLNEDGDPNATLVDVATWLNHFYLGRSVVWGSDSSTTLVGSDGADVLAAHAGNDTVNGGAGNDLIIGDRGNDTLDGGQGDDTFLVTGSSSCEFHGYDAYKDVAGTDTLRLEGPDVDAGVKSFDASCGIEIIDAGAVTGTARLLGDGSANVLDFSGVKIVGTVTIDGDGGNDTITGTGADDVIRGACGNDTVKGGEGNDTFLVSGTTSCGFEGRDAYDGGSGEDSINAVGDNVDIGVKSFDASSGIEIIDAGAVTGTARLLGDGSANVLDFSGVKIVGTVTIDGDGGNDTITGTGGNDVIRGACGDDTVKGGEGDDTFLVSGTTSCGFEGRDAYDGGSGTDTLRAVGDDVDIGVKDFRPSNNMEIIDAGAVTGTARLFGDWSANVLDFSGVKIVGTVTIDGDGGNDTITGTTRGDIIVGGRGNDVLTGGKGWDTFVYRWSDGDDSITDFTIGTDGHDVIDLREMGFGSFADLTFGADSAGYVQIDFGRDEITLVGLVDATVLNADVILV
jgi:Ca2+-binding RTX toxin-like protein